MRRVPLYTIIGNGKMAKHLCHYFDLLNIPYHHWYRAQPKHLLAEAISSSTHILILISDANIDNFIEEMELHTLKDKTLLHFSGSLLSKYAHTTHPLQTFSNEYYTLNAYQKIPFAIEAEGPMFEMLLPGLPNPHFKIKRSLKAYYHSLCVMANNFTTLLWQKIFSEFEEKFNTPASMAMPMLEQTCFNLASDYHNALTGPLARNDQKTLNNDLTALKNDPYALVFQAFMHAYQNGMPHNENK